MKRVIIVSIIAACLFACSAAQPKPDETPQEPARTEATQTEPENAKAEAEKEKPKKSGAFKKIDKVTGYSDPLEPIIHVLIILFGLP